MNSPLVLWLTSYFHLQSTHWLPTTAPSDDSQRCPQTCLAENLTEPFPNMNTIIISILHSLWIWTLLNWWVCVRICRNSCLFQLLCNIAVLTTWVINNVWIRNGKCCNHQAKKLQMYPCLCVSTLFHYLFSYVANTNTKDTHCYFLLFFIKNDIEYFILTPTNLSIYTGTEGIESHYNFRGTETGNVWTTSGCTFVI